MRTYLWQEGCDLYKYVLCYSCLCNHYSYDIDYWLKTFCSKTARIEAGCLYSGKGEHEFELLNLDFVRLIADKYIECDKKFGLVCQKIADIRNLFLILWDDMVEMCETCNNFSGRALIKALCVWFYTFQPEEAKVKMQHLFSFMKNKTHNEQLEHILNLINLIVQYGSIDKHCHNTNCEEVLGPNSKCKDMVQTTPVLIKESKYNAFLGLSAEWNNQVKNLFSIGDLRSKNNHLLQFFMLWKSINEELNMDQRKEFDTTFLNISHVSHLFGNACDLDILPFQLYLDVLVQILSSRENDEECTKHNFAEAISDEFFAHLPYTGNPTGFCGNQKTTVADSNIKDKCDPLIFQRIFYITLKLSSGISRKKIAASVLHSLSDFMKNKMVNSFEDGLPASIVHVFIDDDELLIDAMFSMLKLYQNLGLHTECSVETAELAAVLNPHKMFLLFLRAVGCDHHVLLDFLMSNETCFLPYLLHYLKLLNADWIGFTKVHQEINSSANVSKTSKRTKKEVDLIQTLVCYSSSSGSETDGECMAYEEMCIQQFSIHDVISVFIKLRSAIEKLMEVNEFPYNAVPLIAQLLKCETKGLI